MSESFQRNPILNSPYQEPQKHWRFDEDGLAPDGNTLSGRRDSRFLTPIPAATQRQRKQQGELYLTQEPLQEVENPKINFLRQEIKKWRQKPLAERNVSGVTERLLKHWHNNKVSPPLFFCQIEAAETFIWLNEIAPKSRQQKIIELLQEIKNANEEANMCLPRLAAKMATGSGKTTVMAMLIAYHAINKARAPQKNLYTNKFLIITPGITIKDRLRVLLPQDPNNYYEQNKIAPPDMLAEIKKATVVITNYHAFKCREKIELSKRQREMLRGNNDNDVSFIETAGEMLRRVCPELSRTKNHVVVINDEAHHCYIHKKENEESAIDAEEKEEAKRNKEAARLWINGIRALSEKTAVKNIYDLSATPFFLRGSGYPEGTLFPWTVSDFSLMDAIESGIVKLPRVPIKDATINKLPIYRNLYHHIREHLPKSGRKKNTTSLDPQKLPTELTGAMQALYSHYENVRESWDKNGINIPPVFIIVCNNTSASKLIYDYISGYEKNNRWRHGKFDLFNNVNKNRDGLLARPRTLLIDSYQLESGETMTDEFKKAAATEIDIFKQELRIRYPDRDAGKITDEDLLREVMNTIGKKDRLGEQIRCVVSVSMLTEGWDTNNVTHILGARAFGTQLLCEQVVGRALRRFSYETEEDGKFPPEYANVFGVPFTFMPGDKTPPPPPSKPQTRVRHLDERANLAINYPRARGYRIRPPDERIIANFDNENSRLTITPEIAPPITETQGIIGKNDFMTLDDLKKHRINEVVFSLAAYIAQHYYQTDDCISPARFIDLVPITRRWLTDYVTCLGGTFRQYLLWEKLAAEAAEIIYRACVSQEDAPERLLPIMDPFTPEGSTFYVDFLTRNKRLHKTRADKCHINIAACHSDWEMTFCELLESDNGVFAYTRNAGLGFEAPYTYKEKAHVYEPDFIVLTDDGHGAGDLLNLIVEIKGEITQQTKAKADTMNKLWIPAVNNDGRWGRWAYVEIKDMQNAREMLAKYTFAKVTQTSPTIIKKLFPSIKIIDFSLLLIIITILLI